MGNERRARGDCPRREVSEVNVRQLRIALRAAPLALALFAGCSMSAGDGVVSDAPVPVGCDASAPRASSSARPESVRASCGNGVRESGEDCDEGLNATSATACSQRCKTRDLLVSGAVDGGAARALGTGRHPIAANAGGFALAAIEGGSQLVLRTYDSFGLATGAVVLDPSCSPDAAPSVAALSGNRYAVVWTDNAIDERDVALRVFQVGTTTAGPLLHANGVTNASQYDADIVAVGGQIVVAWSDTSDAANGPDVRYRVFDATTFAPASSDQTLAATNAVEGSVALSAIGSGWAAAWRDGRADGERLQGAFGSTQWTIGPYLAGASGDRPALAALDASHLFAAYGEGTDPGDSGVANTSRLRGVVLDAAAPTILAPFWVSSSPLAQDAPAAVTVGATPFLAWRTAAANGDANAEELWLKPLAWSGTLDTSAPEIPLPRWSQHRIGDQRTPALAASTIAGGALVAAWSDLGTSFAGEGQGGVVFEIAPVPIFRGDGSPDDPACPAGQRYCDSQCTDLSANANNCGGCGFVCDGITNGHGVCVAGTCTAACNSGFHACGSTCAVNNDVATCGAACSPCAAPANAVATCDGTSCGFACNSGFHSCGNACADNTSVATCGASCTPCPAPPNAVATCTASACSFTCNPGFIDCDGVAANGCEAQTATDPNHCGSCTTACPRPASHGTATCSAATCAITCDAGYVACGAACVDTGSDTNNCGGCGHACSTPNGQSACVSGVCAVASCNAGFHQCGSTCASSTSTLTCGASCTPCTAPANATATCDGTSCGFTCNAGTIWDGIQCTDPSTAVFASATGPSSGNGTAAAPYPSLQKAINLAAATHRRVLACADADFREAIILADGVTVLGAFHCAGNNWQYAAGVRARIVAPTSPAVSVANVSAILDSLDITAPDAANGMQPAASSIGLYVANAPALQVVRSVIRAGRGGDGVDGTVGVLTNAGALNGGAGVGGTSQCLRNGVAYGVSNAGGAGGDAGTRTKDCGETICRPGKVCNCIWDITPPGPGGRGAGPAGGAGGVPGGTAAQSGGWGADGASGASAGFAMGAFAQAAPYFVASADGISGADATAGSGGGGSAGIAATTTRDGAVGTGGGAGGCGGLGGGSGRAGGASIAVLVFGSTVAFTNTTLQAGNGGNGGKGAFGVAGTAGGVGAGGTFGAGGNGGNGGAGGNGAGGPSIAIAYTGVQPSVATGIALGGSAGTGVPARTVGAVTIPASADGIVRSYYAF